MNDITPLSEMYRQLCLDTDPMVHAARTVRAAETSADALERDALSSGAIKGEFRVMMHFRRQEPFGFTRLVPFLT